MSARLRNVARRHAFWLLALAVAWLLKQHYRQASAEELRWILAPTAWLSSLFVHGEFVFRAGEGYLNREHSILVSPACAGVNFLVVAFAALVLAFSACFELWHERARWLVASLALAYITTLLVNALRIAASVALAHGLVRATSLDFRSVHRLIGIGTYLAGLLSLCSLVRWRLEPRSGPRSTGTLVLALACYVGVTLLVPLLGGAATNPLFLRHAALISATAAALLVSRAVFHSAASSRALSPVPDRWRARLALRRTPEITTLEPRASAVSTLARAMCAEVRRACRLQPRVRPRVALRAAEHDA